MNELIQRSAFVQNISKYSIINPDRSMQAISSLSIPDLNLSNSTEQQQLYSEDKFVDLLLLLHDRSVLYHCPYDETTLRGFFRQICEREQSMQIPLDTVHQFISELKQRNRALLGQQSEYYTKKMRQLLQNGRKTITRRQLRKMMDRYEGQLQIITQILAQNSKKSQYVGCELVLQLLKEVRAELQDVIVPELSITKLKTLRIGKEEVAGQMEGEVCSYIAPLLGQIQQYQIKKILGKIFSTFEKKLDFYREFISDGEIKEDIEEFLTEMKASERETVQETQRMIQTIEILQQRCRQFDQIAANYREEQSLAADIIDRYKEQVGNLREKLEHVEAQRDRLGDFSTELELAAEETRQQLVLLGLECQKVSLELDQYKRRHFETLNQFEKLAEENRNKSILMKEQSNKKIFATRTLKQQLEDAGYKLNKLLNQRQKERKQFKQQDQVYRNHIITLEERLEQLELQLREKNQYLDNYVRESQFRASTASIIPKTKLTSSKINQRISNISADSVILQGGSFRPPSRKFTKANKIDIGAVQPIPEEASDVWDISEIYEQQNLLLVIRDDCVVNENAFKKEKNEVKDVNKSADGSAGKSAQSSPQKAKKWKIGEKYFCSRAVIINVYGKKFETWVVLTKKRFCFFDSKMRLDRFLFIENIKQIVFTSDNPNLFVIRPLNPDKLSQSKHILNEMMFTTRNCRNFQLMLAQLKELGIFKGKVIFSKAENIWIHFNGNQYNLKLSVPQNYNPFRLSLTYPKVFYAVIRQESLFGSRTNAIIVIQPIGLLCFEGYEAYELQEKRQLIAFLPLVEDMKIIEKKNSREAPDKKIVLEYLDKEWGKYYGIIFSTREEARKFKKAVEDQLEINSREREQRSKTAIRLFNQNG